MKLPLRTQWSLSLTARLLLGLLPSLLAAALVAGLVYWGEYGRQAPHVVLAAAGILAAFALGLTILNVRYLVQRFDRLTEMIKVEAARQAPAARTGTTDEFDRIEQVVGELGTALTRSVQEKLRADKHSAARLNEQSTLLAALVRDTLSRLDDVRMPLHILLEAKFGELNENQEELLRDARNASDQLDDALRRMGQVAEADRDAMPVQRELVQVNEVVRSILPLIRASAERRGARVDVQLEPAMPRVSADRARLAEALSLLAVAAVGACDEGQMVSLTTRRQGGGVEVALRPWSASAAEDLRVALAYRYLSVQGSVVRITDGALLALLGAA